MVYARRQTRPKPRQAVPTRWPAPVAGWVSNRALSDPRSVDGPGAAVLDNFFPKATGVALRRGKSRYATLTEADLNVTSLFTYRNGANEKFFAANEARIYDVTNVLFPVPADLGDGEGNTLGDGLGNVFGWNSTDGMDVATDFTSGDWSVIQYATTGGIYLVGVNGADTGFIYDGEAFYPNVAGGVWRLDVSGVTTDFENGEVITGGTSGASGTIWRVRDGYLLLTGVTGTFDNGEALTGSVAGAATVAGEQSSAAPGVDFGDLTSAAMSFVWIYQNRLWFVERDTLNAWYLDVDSVGGTATVFPMGGIFAQGGSLLFGQRWSLESGGQGGLSDQNVFVSDQGEVAIFQGPSPAEAATWSLVGVYRIGAPLGKRAYIRGGGDLAIATTVGLVPLSKAISLDVTALNVATISYKIADAWTDAVARRGSSGWQAMVWPEQKMAMIAPPDTVNAQEPVVFVANAETGAWARFTNWQAFCFEVFRGQMFFGSTNGCIYEANVGGLDDGVTYSGAVVPLFADMGASASAKVGKMVRARVRATTTITDRADILADFDVTLPPAPDATAVPASNLWGSGEWGSSIWGAATPNVLNQDWRSAGSIGYSIAPCYQVTSGAPAPIDVELVDFDTLHTTAEVVT